MQRGETTAEARPRNIPMYTGINGASQGKENHYSRIHRHWAPLVTPLVKAQGAIQPIKPIPPIGCKDLTPECVKENNRQTYWTWICVPYGTVPDATVNQSEPGYSVNENAPKG